MKIRVKKIPENYPKQEIPHESTNLQVKGRRNWKTNTEKYTLENKSCKLNTGKRGKRKNKKIEHVWIVLKKCLI